MGRRDKRLGAQDIFDQATYIFPKKAPFSEVFPQIASLLVEFEETGEVSHADRYEGFRPVRCERLTLQTISQYIRCTNHRCYAGGFEICEVIGEMARRKETEREGEAYCIGHEGTPKGRKIYGKCFNRFRYKVTIGYVE